MGRMGSDIWGTMGRVREKKKKNTSASSPACWRYRSISLKRLEYPLTCVKGVGSTSSDTFRGGLCESGGMAAAVLAPVLPLALVGADMAGGGVRRGVDEEVVASRRPPVLPNATRDPPSTESESTATAEKRKALIGAFLSRFNFPAHVFLFFVHE